VWQTGVGVGGLLASGDVGDANNSLVLRIPVDNGICLAGGGIFLFEHFGQSLFITFVEEWDLVSMSDKIFLQTVDKEAEKESNDSDKGCSCKDYFHSLISSTFL